MNFVAIDFETANQRRASACAIGVAVVENGEVTQQFSQLIKPEPCQFHYINIGVHGIHPEDVTDAPTFEELWGDLRPWIEDKNLVAHNMPFDKSVLHKSLEYYDLALPRYVEYFCSLKFSRKLLPELPRHKLSHVADHFGIDLIHHDAGSDALACAKIMIELGKKYQVEQIEDFARL